MMTEMTPTMLIILTERKQWDGSSGKNYSNRFESSDVISQTGHSYFRLVSGLQSTCNENQSVLYLS